MKAKHQDEDFVAAIVEREVEDDDEAPSWSPAAEDWTLLHEMLAQVFDRLGALAMITAHAKPEAKGPDPFPRPVTALSKARESMKQVKLDRYDEKLLDVVAKAQQRWRDLSEEERDAMVQRPQLPAPPGTAG
jgi:hypothetical protein